MGTIKDFRLSVKAGLDLEDIFRYSEQQWGYAQAEIYIRGLIGSFTDLAGKKKSGRQCDYIRPHLFSCVYLAHVIFYRRTHYGIFIVRVLHGAMDFQRHL
jgi:toxin ParE1/3/4